MEKYYVSGCRDDGEATVTCDDSEATFWTLYARDDKGLSHGIIDLAFREDAEAAMQVYIMRDAHFAAEMVWEKTMMETIGEDGVGSVKAAIERLQAERDALQEQVQKLATENISLKKFCKNAAFDADYESSLGMERGGFTDGLNDIKTPATDAVIREVGAKAVDKYLAEMDELSMQIRRLVHALKISNPDNSLIKSVPDYMRRNGHWKVTDCLRAGEQP